MVPVSSTKQKPSGMTNMDLTAQDMPMDRGLHSIGPTVEPTPMGSYCTLAERRRLEERNAELHRQLSQVAKSRDEALAWGESLKRAIDTIANRIGAYKRADVEEKVKTAEVAKKLKESEASYEYLRKRLEQSEKAANANWQHDSRINEMAKRLNAIDKFCSEADVRLDRVEDSVVELTAKTVALTPLGGEPIVSNRGD